MVQIFEKVPKTRLYPSGERVVDQYQNPFVSGPVLLCITQNNETKGIDRDESKEIFGTTDEFMKMARLRVGSSRNAGISLRNFPVKFISFKYFNEGDSKEEAIERFVNTYLLALISNYGKKVSEAVAKKRIRNLNIATYGTGIVDAYKIEKHLFKSMVDLGYDKDEINNILSQVFAMYVGAPDLPADDRFTAVSFRDTMDEKSNKKIEKISKDATKYHPLGANYFHKKYNLGEFLVQGDGKSELSSYSKKGDIFPVVMNSVLYSALLNSVRNTKEITEAVLPITLDTVLYGTAPYIKMATNKVPGTDILKSFDNKIAYPGGFIRLSSQEMDLADERDEIADALVEAQDKQFGVNLSTDEALPSSGHTLKKTLPGRMPNTLPGVGDGDIEL